MGGAGLAGDRGGADAVAVRGVPGRRRGLAACFLAPLDAAGLAGPDAEPPWRGRQIVDTVAGTAADDTGIVEFRATYVHERDLQVLHERSRFVREAGRWYYLDAIDTVL